MMTGNPRFARTLKEQTVWVFGEIESTREE
jgi:hypothetical protein